MLTAQPREEADSEKTSDSRLDTTIIVYSAAGKPLGFRQYSQLIRTGKYIFKMRDGKKVVEKIPDDMLQYMTVDSAIAEDLLLQWTAMADKIIVNKAERKLLVERNSKVIFEFPVQLGKNPIGAKQKEGDGRTPEGLYSIDYNANRDPAYYHGFHISYPNERDSLDAKRLGIKPGGDIMIHGTGPTRIGLKDWTNGCIAISNAHIDTLIKYTRNGISIEVRK